MSNYSAELELARHVAELGARTALTYYRRDPTRRQKSDGTWVTEADTAIEAQIRAEIARAFPDHNIHGEEEGLTAAAGGAPRDGAPTWVVDPIDGTNNFMNGIPVWGTLVGLRIGDESVVGAAACPALGETYDAAIGLGARMNGDPIKVAPVERLQDATVLHADARSFEAYGLMPFFDTLVQRSWRAAGFADCWGHLLVARGAAQVMAEPILALWDFVALEPIVREAGGTMSQLTGEPLADGRSVLTTCGSLHDDVVRIARDTSSA